MHVLSSTKRLKCLTQALSQRYLSCAALEAFITMSDFQKSMLQNKGHMHLMQINDFSCLLSKYELIKDLHYSIYLTAMYMYVYSHTRCKKKESCFLLIDLHSIPVPLMRPSLPSLEVLIRSRQRSLQWSSTVGRPRWPS